LIYATANETSYEDDFINLSLILKEDPGVEKVIIYIAISKVREKKRSFSSAFSRLLQKVAKHPRYELRDVFFKSNIGRDFSSVKMCLDKIAAEANDNDIIMVRNRSARGPYKKNWYKSYRDLLLKQDEVKLVGNTINFAGLSHMKKSGVNTHIQTYLYLSQWKYFRQISANFPGITETKRKRVIEFGEIQLSKWYLDNGYSISCLAWPNFFFSKSNSVDDFLPQKDIKKSVEGLPFLHRSNKGNSWFIQLRISWKFLRIKAYLWSQIRSIRSQD